MMFVVKLDWDRMSDRLTNELNLQVETIQSIAISLCRSDIIRYNITHIV